MLKTDTDFAYHPKCKNLDLTHLCYADDLMVFCREDKQAVMSVLRALGDFGLTSGLYMNEGKSNIYLSGVKPEDRAAILEESHLREGDIPFRYLGIPMHHRTLHVAEYRPLVQKLQQRINNWATRKLSYAGRAMLINDVLNSIIRFWSAIFHFPVGLVHEMERICRDFLWTGGEGARGKARVAWSQVCQERANGGIGIKEVLAWNKATMFSILCDIHVAEAPSLWVKWLRTYRLRNQTIWEVQPRPSDSGWWRKILMVRNEICSQLTMNMRQVLQLSRSDRENLVYACLHPPAEEVAWSAMLWNRATIPKTAFIMWLACRSRLNTKDQVSKFNTYVEQMCCLCGEAEETHSHLFFECGFLKAV